MGIAYFLSLTFHREKKLLYFQGRRVQEHLGSLSLPHHSLPDIRGITSADRGKEHLKSTGPCSQE
jgi:hypothetical protein